MVKHLLGGAHIDGDRPLAVALNVEGAAEGDVLKVQSDGTVAPESGSYPTVRVRRTATQSIAHNTHDYVNWTAADDYDTDDFHDHTAGDPADTKVTIPAGLGGKYKVVAQIGWASNSSGDRAIELHVNATKVGVDSRRPVAGFATHEQLTWEGELAAGDEVQLDVFQSSGGALNIDPSTVPLYMTVSRITA